MSFHLFFTTHTVVHKSCQSMHGDGTRFATLDRNYAVFIVFMPTQVSCLAATVLSNRVVL